MQTEIISIDSCDPQKDTLQKAASILRNGGLVAFPTETVYGLGGDALSESAVQKIFAAKGRPPNNPLIVHVHNIEAAKTLAEDWPANAEKLAARFWPGSLTLVVNKKDTIPGIVTAGGPTVALRVPAHPVALGLLQFANVPVAAPSANRSNRLSPTTSEHVLRDLDGRIDLILDAGPASGGLESTVLDVTARPPRLLRPGLVTVDEIEQVVGPVERLESDLVVTRVLRSPGLLGKHYAPRTPLELASGSECQRVEALLKQGHRVGWLTLSDSNESEHPKLVKVVMPCTAKLYSARLYAALHELDDSGVDRIVVDLPPATQEWFAVHDRLKRAAAI